MRSEGRLDAVDGLFGFLDHVMYIVTEWGAADLHNQPLETRICAMIRIAHPRFRCALAQEAVAWGQLSPECAAQFDTQPEPEEEETT